MIDQQLASSISKPASRRRLLHLIAAGGAAAVSTLLPRHGVRAGHGIEDSAEVLHLERDNSAHARTLLESDSDTPTITLRNVSGAANALEAESTAEVIVVRLLGDATFHTVQAEHLGQGGGAAVAGFGVGLGVLGQASLVGDESALGAGTGVMGLSSSGTGVEGHSESGFGVHAHSNTGQGGHFSSDTGTALSTNGPVDVWGDRPRRLVGIENVDISEDAGAISATSRGGGRTIEANIFQAEEDPDLGPGFFGVAVQGVSSSGTPEDGVYGDGPGIGVAGFSGRGAGVSGTCGHGPGVVGQSDTSAGVMGGGTSDPGLRAGVLGGAPGDKPGVQALSAEFFGLGFGEPDGGLALEVIGRSRFSTAGSGTVAQGDSSVAVVAPAVTAASHITVTLTGDPGPRQLWWVERNPGAGFTVHLTSAPPPQRPATGFTYLIVEPAA